MKQPQSREASTGEAPSVLCLRVLLGVLFLWAGISKFVWIDHPTYRATFVFDALGGHRGLVILVGATEAAIAAALLFRVRVTASASILALGVLAMGAVYMFAAGDSQPCGCLGPKRAEAHLPFSPSIRAACLALALSTLAIRTWARQRGRGSSSRQRRDSGDLGTDPAAS